MMKSLFGNLWQLILAQSACEGIGAGGLFPAAVAIVPAYLASKKSLATGITAKGSSPGGVIYPIMFRQLEPSVGFGWAVRFSWFTISATSSVPCLTINMRFRRQGMSRAIDFSILPETSLDVSSLA